jgi:hypothetical protein
VSRRLDALLGAQRQQVRARDTSAWAAKEKRLLASLHPRQRAFVLDPGRRVAALVARGGGKTTGGLSRLVRRMLRTPKARCLFIATTQKQAEELIWQQLKDLLEKLGIEASFNEVKLRCTLRRNGAQLRLVGADNKKSIEKLRGIPHHEVGIDEMASYPAQLLEHLIERIIAPRLGDYGGVLWMIGTPGHILAGPAYEVTRPGSEIARLWDERDKPEYEGWLRWSTHHWSLEDGAPHVPEMAKLWAEALLEKEANGWSDDNPVWLREYKGQWAADDTENVFRYRPHNEEGAEWNRWDPERDPRTGFAKLPPGNWSYVLGMDMGHSDPFALQVFAFREGERGLCHVYEFERRGMFPRTIAEVLVGADWVERITSGKDPGEPGGVMAATGWPDGMVADLAGLGGAILDELATTYGVRIAPAEKKHKHDAIELFNGDLVDGHIKILKGSRLEEQLLHLQWAVDEYGNLKENKSQRNDCTDAAIYARRLARHLFAEEAPKRSSQGAHARFDQTTTEEPREDARDDADFSGMLAEESFTDLWGN